MITRETVKQIRQDVEAFLETMKAKHGVSFELGIIRYDAATMRATLSGEKRGGSTQQVVTNDYASLIGKTFKFRRSIFTIMGYDSKKPKFAFKVKNQNGTVYLMSREDVINGLNK